MKTNVQRLSFIDVDLFYTISIWNSEISLQGTLSSELIKYCKAELNIDLSPNEEDWLQGQSNSIELGIIKVTLT
jgi:hypothetical protein